MRLLAWLPPVLGAAGLLAASSCTERPHENFVSPVTGAGGVAGAPGTGGHSQGPENLGGGGLGGASASSGGSQGSTGGSGAGATVSWTVEDDCEAPSGDTPAFTRAALREAAASCAEYYYCRFEAVSHVLVDHVEAFASDPSAAHRQVAGEVLVEALERWAVIESMQFGPVASATATAGRDIYQGQGVRSVVYSWPQVSRCRVDEQVALQKYLSAGMSDALVSGRGLFGLEATLFYPGLDTECGTNTTTADVWATLDAASIEARRRGYAVALADDIRGYAEGLVDVWSPDGGNFHQTFVSASGYPDEQEAMNVLGWSLLYIEREVKDWKLGVPAGYTVGAPVSEPEANFSGEQTALLRANLQGFRRLFQGCGSDYAGLGFDDWLVDAGHEDLADDIVLATIAAEAALANLPRFPTASTAQIQSTYAAVKVLTDLLKADLFGTGSVLNLKLPASLEGDTD